MKKILVLLICILFANVLIAQVTFKNLVKDCQFAVVGNEKYDKFGYFNSHGEKVTCTLDDMVSLLRKDLIAYYGLGNRYNTELKVKAYKQTDDYQDTYETMMEEYNFFTQGKGYLLYNLRYNSNYDTAKRCFLFKIGFDDLYKYSQPNYLCFEKGLVLTYPNAYLSRTTQNTNLASNGIFNYNILKTTVIPEEKALKIENEMESPNCNVRLLLIFKITKSATEKKVVGGYYVNQNFVIGKTIAAYIINQKTGEVYADMSYIFIQHKKPTTQRRR